jgi:hemoglobin
MIEGELSAWDRLGGTETMRRVVGILVERAASDPRVNYDRSGRFPQNHETMARTKSLALAFLSKALGGPLSYNGRSLAEVHQPMAINADELDAFLSHFTDAMSECGLPPSVAAKVAAAVTAVRPAILASSD